MQPFFLSKKLVVDLLVAMGYGDHELMPVRQSDAAEMEELTESLRRTNWDLTPFTFRLNGGMDR